MERPNRFVSLLVCAVAAHTLAFSRLASAFTNVHPVYDGLHLDGKVYYYTPKTGYKDFESVKVPGYITVKGRKIDLTGRVKFKDAGRTLVKFVRATAPLALTSSVIDYLATRGIRPSPDGKDWVFQQDATMFELPQEVGKAVTIPDNEVDNFEKNALLTRDLRGCTFYDYQVSRESGDSWRKRCDRIMEVNRKQDSPRDIVIRKVNDHKFIVYCHATDFWAPGVDAYFDLSYFTCAPKIIPVTRPVTEEDWEKLEESAVPDEVMHDLAKTTPVPVEVVADPATVPLSEPYQTPKGNYKQDVARITPMKDGSVMVDAQTNTLKSPEVGPDGIATNIDPEKTEKPQDILDFCDKYPSSIVCAELDIPQEEIPKSEKTITLTPVPISLPAQCPPPHVIQTSYGTAEIKYDSMCDFATRIRPVVILMGLVVAAYIFVGGLKSG